MNFTHRKLRPTGNPIALNEFQLEISEFQDFDTNFYQSGTAALAAAIIASIKLKNNTIATPEIIIPAYSCPDIISAIIFANAKPILVDFIPDKPFMSLDGIEKSITKNTIGIVAINFLGIPERTNLIKNICSKHKLSLIEDSAQGFPVYKKNSYWHGDFIVLSFGRGKPVNLLSGGALLSKSNSDYIPEINSQTLKKIEHFKYYLKIRIYNLIIKPTIYNLITKLPNLQVGKTVFKKLNTLQNIPETTKKYLPANIYAYKHNKTTCKTAKTISTLLNNLKVIDLPSSTQHDFNNPLLRYPILFHDNKSRNIALQKLEAFGATAMYNNLLPSITGASNYISSTSDNYPNAVKFSKSLLTLPTHKDVTIRDINIIMDIIKNILKQHSIT